MAKTLFPVGFYEKRKIRALAKQFNLPVAEKKDSQGICFLGSISVEEFLRSEFDVVPGRAVDEQGRVLGQHDSVLLSTIGERVALKETSEKGPWYVLAKNVAKNELVVGKARVPHSLPSCREITFSDANWVGVVENVTEAQYRYRGPRILGSVNGNRFVSTEALLEIPAPGQSLVFYHDKELIGGGIIS